MMPMQRAARDGLLVADTSTGIFELVKTLSVCEPSSERLGKLDGAADRRRRELRFVDRDQQVTVHGGSRRGQAAWTSPALSLFQLGANPFAASVSSASL